MKQKLTYLTAITLLVASCTSDDIGVDKTNTLSGDGNKTPLVASASLNDGSAVTRAADNKFETGDKLLSYVRHVTWDGTESDGKPTGTLTSVAADDAPRLVTFTYGSTQEEGTPTSTTTDLTVEGGLYWDDFSDSNSADTDLRTAGHYLQSYYGYCYNGGTPSTALVEATGVLGWTVPTNQTAGSKSADLLWSAEQTPISYKHADKNAGGDHTTLTLPYTHAMSEVTIIVKTGAGFEEVQNPLANTTLTLVDWNINGTLTAPSQEIVAGTAANIDMYKKTINADKTEATFTAITVPKTSLSIGNSIAKIKDADGNNYDIKVTASILSAWSSQLDEGGAEHIQNGIAQVKTRTAELYEGTAKMTKPGVNYVLTITINKVQVSVEASISNWVNVFAETSASTEFKNDVVSFNFATGTYNNGDQFSLYALNSNGISGTPTNSNYNSGKTSTATYNASDLKWNCDPILYWPNSSDALYFRAMATNDGSKYSKMTSTTVKQGSDVVWATTASHRGNDIDGDEFSYNEGQAIKPRTGDIPLQMYHAMSKISVKLETAEGDASSATSPAVNLRGAKIEITNIAISGTIALNDGVITPGDVDAAGVTPMNAPIENYCVIPQSISDAAFIRITLADGTTYKAQLNACVDSSSSDDPKSPITKWERGKHYTYTIYLEKEKITFRALIKDWEEKTGSGNATMEWD